MNGETSRRAVELTSFVSIEEGALESIPEVLKGLGVKRRALLVCDSITYDLAGKRIEEILTSNGYEVGVVTITDADMKNIERVKVEGGTSDAILGVGGGRPIDVAKYTAYLTEIPFISVPTAASHDGVASGRASINVNGKKTSLPARVPAAVVADTELISSAPKRLNISGVADVVSNITAVNDWYLAHRIKGEWISPLAAELSLLAARRLLDNREVLKEMDVDGVKVLMEAVVLSGASMAIAGSSRPASGAEHLISHALDSLAPRPALHGEQCGLASIFTSYLQGEDWREIKDFLDYLGAPVTLNDLGIEKEVFIKAATEAHRIRPERYTILGDGITEEAALSAAKRTGIIP